MGTSVSTAETNPLRAWRLGQGLLQREVAEMIGVDRQQVVAWEVGRMRPGIANQMRLARLLGVGLLELRQRWR